MDSELKKKMVGLQKKAIKDIGENADVLITTFKEGECGVILHGSTQNVAHSLFALLHDQNNKISMDLYRIIKLVVLNIVNNESPYAADLLTGILNVQAPQQPQSEKSEEDKKAVCVKLPLPNERK